MNPEASRDTRPTARAEHTCVECHAKIAPGETYRRFEGLYEESWSTFKQCEPCADLSARTTKALRTHPLGYELLFGDLLTTIVEAELFGGVADPQVRAADLRYALNVHRENYLRYAHPEVDTPEAAQLRRASYRIQNLDRFATELCAVLDAKEAEEAEEDEEEEAEEAEEEEPC